MQFIPGSAGGILLRLFTNMSVRPFYKVWVDRQHSQKVASVFIGFKDGQTGTVILHGADNEGHSGVPAFHNIQLFQKVADTAVPVSS